MNKQYILYTILASSIIFGGIVSTTNPIVFPLVLLVCGIVYITDKWIESDQQTEMRTLKQTYEKAEAQRTEDFATLLKEVNIVSRAMETRIASLEDEIGKLRMVQGFTQKRG